eukprot:10952981-Alexandrium_andersonii.AAC.1
MSELPSLIVSELPSARASGLQTLRVSELPKFQASEFQSFRISEFTNFRALRVSEFHRASGLQTFLVQLVCQFIIPPCLGPGLPNPPLDNRPMPHPLWRHGDVKRMMLQKVLYIAVRMHGRSEYPAP